MITQFWQGMALLINGDSGLWNIISLSLWVSLSAVVVASIIGLGGAIVLSLYTVPLRRTFLIITHTMLGLPPVVVGLLVYLLLSQTGPFGGLNLLFTPSAMIIAQILLVVPIVLAYAHDILIDSHRLHGDHLRSLGAKPWQIGLILMHDTRYALILVILHGFGRAISEVGAVMIVGGNILHHTRVMTSSITLYTSQGNLGLAMALGAMLLGIGLLVTLVAFALRRIAIAQDIS